MTLLSRWYYVFAEYGYAYILLAAFVAITVLVTAIGTDINLAAAGAVFFVV
jgi:hypothetical protein